MYGKLNNFLKSETSKMFKDYKSMNKEHKKDKEDKVLEYLVASWVSNQSINTAKNYVINENDRISTGIDVVFFNKKTLYLIQVKNTDKVNSGQYSKSRIKADEIDQILTDPNKSKIEKQKLTNINSKVMDWLEERNWIYESEFLFVYNSEKKCQLNNWVDPSEVEKHMMRLVDFFKKIILEINTGFKIVNDIKHVLNIEHEKAKNTIVYTDGMNKGLIFPIKAMDLIRIIEDEINNGNTLDSIFEGNVRYKVKTNIINSEIKESLKKNELNFFLLNNGITILVDNLLFNKDRRNIISFQNCNIINGQQTVRSLYELYIEGKKENLDLSNIIILVKLYELKQKELEIKIPFASNNQNKIDVKDLMSLKTFQKNVKEILIKKEIFYIYKKGLSEVNNASKFFNNTITSEELIKLFASCYDKQVTVKNNLNKMFEEVYSDIGKGNLKQSSTYYNTEEAILSLENNSKEAINKMLKLVFIYINLKSDQYKKIWHEQPKSFDIINYVFYMFLRFEKDDFIKDFLTKNFKDIFNLLNKYFKSKMTQIEQDEADFFRFSKNWDDFCKKIEEICFDNENIENKVSLLKEYLIGEEIKKMENIEESEIIIS